MRGQKNGFICLLFGYWQSDGLGGGIKCGCCLLPFMGGED